MSTSPPNTALFRRTRIEIGKASTARSLCWRDDALVDWVGGGNSWAMDGRFTSASRSWGYRRFNAVAADSTGHWALVHERTGTAGLLIHGGRIIREIHRSPYHADAFEYPACLFERSGRVLLAHCPDNYARLEIDDAESGERLTKSTSRKEPDFFHSRLAVSPGGRTLLSAGWVWQPWDAVLWFDVDAAMRNPSTLDALNGPELSRNVCLSEESSAAWLDNDRLLIGGSSEPEDTEESAETDRQHPGPRLKPNSMAVFDIPTRNYTMAIELGHPPGRMMRAGPNHVLTFYKHPRLVSLQSREVILEWADIDSGEMVSSIVHDRPYPVLALDPLRGRFAVAGKDVIEVIELELSKLG